MNDQVLDQKPVHLIKATDIASRLQISRSKAYQLLKQGVIPTIRIGGVVRVREGDFEEFIQRSWSGWKPP